METYELTEPNNNNCIICCRTDKFWQTENSVNRYLAAVTIQEQWSFKIHLFISFLDVTEFLLHYYKYLLIRGVFGLTRH